MRGSIQLVQSNVDSRIIIGIYRGYRGTMENGSYYLGFRVEGCRPMINTPPPF